MKKYYSRLTTCISLAVVLGLIVVMEAATGLGQPAAAGTEQQPAPPLVRSGGAGWEAYKVIVERNMFSRQRGARPERSDRRETRTPPAPNPESYYVLKGIVQEDDVFICFLEDTQRGEILRIRKGDSVARGVVKALSLDSIEYQFEDRTVTVTIGHDLEGGRGAVTMTQLYELAQTSSASPQQGATGASGESGPSADEAEILRKLMERRRQQLGQ
jgi:hypothetical protein